MSDEFGTTIADYGTIKTFESVSFHQQPVFPASISIGAATVTLRADGTWDGDPDALAAEMVILCGMYGDVAALLWLILREMRRDRADAAAAERIMENGERMKAAWDADRT